MSYLKLIESGVPKEKLGLLAVPLTPLQLILPFLLSRYTNGTSPFNLYIKAIPYRLVMSVVVAVWVYITPLFKDSSNEYPIYYYILCLIINSVQTVFTYSMFVSQMAFFAKVSDPQIGGTYMTFLNTVTNMGNYLTFVFSF
jgi:PAT family acetyl-CoA transporter-like MFS transporter 1